MADSTTSFLENPFKKLDRRQFPQQKKEVPPGQACKKLSRHLQTVETIQTDEEDTQLFLRTVACGQRSKETLQGGSFSLADCTPLPGTVSRKKKKKTKKVQREESPPFEGSVSSSPVEQDEELGAFWDAMKEVAPLQGKGRAVIPAVQPATGIPLGTEMSLQDFMEGKLEFALSFTDEYLEGHVVGLDQMLMHKLRAGGFSPEAHLDLHGLNVPQAFEALRGFLRSCWYRGLRTIILVPGRGKNSPDGIGILRSKLQLWLTQEPFKRVVLAFCTAQPHDGGAGSLYVLLRKYKKKGKIYWERLPVDEDLY